MAPTVPNTGEAAIVTALVRDATATTASGMRWIGWGSTATAETETDTDLINALGENRVGTNAPTQVTVGTTNDTLQVIQTISATASRTVREVGLFNTSAGTVSPGALCMRATHGDLVLLSGDAVEYTLQEQMT